MMCSFWLKNQNFQTPIKLNRGKFDSLTRPITLILFLNLGFCLFNGVYSGGGDEIMPLVSVPLGFEINAFDKSKIWVSENGVFSFGFLDSCEKNENGDFDALIVGIRFNLGSKKGSDVPVWSIGGGIRVSENSTFRLSSDGRMVLIENSNGLIVWSSNTSNLRVEKATLLNNGNLVLIDDRNAVIWESFNSPTSTLLPGQSLRFPQTLRAPSTKTISSYYNFVIRRDGELALMWESNVTYWRSLLRSTSHDITIKEARFDSNGVLSLVDDASNTVWSRSGQDFFEGSSRVLRRLKIDPDGNLRIYSWDDSARTWRVGWQAVEDQCDVFGYCGLYSLCGYNSTGPVCGCMSQHSLSLRNGRVDSGSSKCKPVSDLSSCKTNTSMMVLRQTALYGLYPPIDVDLMLSENSCKEFCVNDTTCVAVTSKNDGSGLCTVKRTNFISGYRNPSLSSTSFMKVCLVPLAVSAESANMHPNAELIPPSSKRSITHGLGSKKLIGAIALLAFATILIVVTVEVVALYAFFRRKQSKERDEVPFLKEAKMNPHYSLLVRLAFEEVRKATHNFSDELSPSVFKGMLPNKTPIVAKVLNNVVSSEKDFRFSIATLGATYHRNLVGMKGFCFEPNHKIILYEYIPTGSLHEWLLNTCNDPSDRKWKQRLDIAVGVGRALAYLHTECQSCIPHGNLKLKNVLLDDKVIPMVTNFGICSLLRNPDEGSSSASTSASCMESLAQRDIYMFGEMLLQIATLKLDMQMEADFHDILGVIVEEQDTVNEEEREGVERVVRIALWCMQHKPFLRPSVGEVVKVLEGTLSVDMPPFSQNRN